MRRLMRFVGPAQAEKAVGHTEPQDTVALRLKRWHPTQAGDQYRLSQYVKPRQMPGLFALEPRDAQTTERRPTLGNLVWRQTALGLSGMVSPVQRPRGPMGHHEGYAHLPWPSDVTPKMIATWRADYLASNADRRIQVGESFTIPDGAWLLDASTHEGKRYVVVEQDVGSVQPAPTQMDRIESLLATLVEALADEGEELEQPELTLDGEAVGGERDDTQPL